MLKHTVFITIFIAVLAFVSGEDVVELTDVQTTVADTNPAAVATLSQLRVQKSGDPDGINTYKCTVGSQPTCKYSSFYIWIEISIQKKKKWFIFLKHSSSGLYCER